MDYVQLTQLHKMYGFELSKETDDYIIYTQFFGFFRLAIILQKSITVDISGIIKEYTDIGFSCLVKNYTSLENAQRELYKNYFRIEESRNRGLNEYRQFCESQKKRLASEYTYINSGMSIDGVPCNADGIEKICKLIEAHNNDPQLIIIEAAAGFGKTCTANEIFKLICTRDNDMVPIYIELSKNRIAPIFRYILLDEIDRKFSFMNTEVVQAEIARGNVPLIVDGFDELISRAMKVLQDDGIDDTPQFEDAESMLDTIAELLTQDAKVIITARKSSIFYGDDFEKWVDDHWSSFNVVRVVINEPEISDWVSIEKRAIIEQTGVPLQQIANPVLLAYLKNCSLDQLATQCAQNQSIVDQYFRILLEREKTRQNIPLLVDEQYRLLENLAGAMMALDISTCSRDDIRELIIMNDENTLAKMIDERYPNTAEKPTVNDLAMKLAGHALLDRQAADSNNIGFINGFVFGDLLASYICNNNTVDGISAYFIDLAVTAYSSRFEEKRKALFDSIQEYFDRLNLSERLFVDIQLLKKTTQNYHNFLFSDMIIQAPYEFTREFHFMNCQFKNCIFRNVTIYSDTFMHCSFWECKFTQCEFIYEGDSDNANSFYDCIGADQYESFYDIIQSALDSSHDYRKQILEQYWLRGRSSTQTRCTYRTLICGISPNEYRQVDRCIKELRHENYIYRVGQYYYLNMEKFNEIRAILGR